MTIDPATSAYYVGDCRTLLRQLPDGCVQTCITSPPYWGLRDYEHDGQIGLEDTPEEYVATLVDVFDEVRRVLKDDGTLWLNLGDCYVTNPRGPGGAPSDRAPLARSPRSTSDCGSDSTSTPSTPNSPGTAQPNDPCHWQEGDNQCHPSQLIPSSRIFMASRSSPSSPPMASLAT